MKTTKEEREKNKIKNKRESAIVTMLGAKGIIQRLVFKELLNKKEVK